MHGNHQVKNQTTVSALRAGSGNQYPAHQQRGGVQHERGIADVRSLHRRDGHDITPWKTMTHLFADNPLRPTVSRV